MQEEHFDVEDIVDSEAEGGRNTESRPDTAFQTKRNQKSFSRPDNRKGATLNSFQKSNKGSMKNMKSNAASFTPPTKSKPRPAKAHLQSTKSQQNSPSSASQNLNHRLANLEAELAQRMKERLDEEALVRENKVTAIRDRRIRLSIPRLHAALVEDILHQYNLLHVNFYEMLRVKPSTEESVIKKNYRNMALLLHPGLLSDYFFVSYYGINSY